MSALPPSPPRPSVPHSFPSAPCPPGPEAPATCEVPAFDPVRVGHSRYRLGRLVRSRRRALAIGLAVTAAALVAATPRDGDPARGHPDGDAHGNSPSGARSSAHAPASPTRTAGKVTAPVRIADAATVRLLRPGDRVDVIAVEQPTAVAAGGGTGGEARVVARGALVTKVPEPLDAPDSAPATTFGGSGGSGGSGALVVLSVPRPTAARLAGASATARLAVTVW
ncbi:RcpC/CpaB family pilus assembly protein [Streptomyces sp. NBC_00704]|uniref:RcpC/CpaB family pilus assembly protein n=1 Tax=Streptomyces sp. NBC_00704 TaxID=2975809 RepID=UPI003247A7BD